MNDTPDTPIPFVEALRQIEALTLRIRQERLGAFERSKKPTLRCSNCVLCSSRGWLLYDQ